MRNHRRERWFVQRARGVIADNQWFLPTVGVLLGLILALVVGTGSGDESVGWTITVDRSRDTLIATLGLVFTSLSIVLALSSVAAQNIVGRFGSRALRIYLRRSIDRWVVGAFALTATFIISVEYQLRTVDSDAAAPVAALSISVLLLGLTGSLLIWYISATIRWFRVDNAVALVMESERRAIRSASRHRRGTAAVAALPERPDGASNIVAPRSGFLAEIDHDSILEMARNFDAMVTITEPLRAAVGRYDSIGWVSSRSGSQPEANVAHQIDISRTRRVGESIEYGLYALVDIAIMALSPAVNDPNSAVEVIEEMTFMFLDLSKEPLGPYAVPDGDSWPRVVVAARTFGELVELATAQVVLYGITDPNVALALRRLARALNQLQLSDDDQCYVNQFAAKLDAAPTDG